MNWLERLLDRSAPPAVPRASFSPPGPAPSDPDDLDAAPLETPPIDPPTDAASLTPSSTPRRPPRVSEPSPFGLREPARALDAPQVPSVPHRPPEAPTSHADPPRLEDADPAVSSRPQWPTAADVPPPPPRHDAPPSVSNPLPIPPLHRETRQETVRVVETDAAPPAPASPRLREELRPEPSPAVLQPARASLSIGRVVVEVVAPAATPAPTAPAVKPRVAPSPLRSGRESTLRFGLGMT